MKNLNFFNKFIFGKIKLTLLFCLVFVKLNAQNELCNSGIPDFFIVTYSQEHTLDTINQKFYIKFKIYFVDTINRLF